MPKFILKLVSSYITTIKCQLFRVSLEDCSWPEVDVQALSPVGLHQVQHMSSRNLPKPVIAMRIHAQMPSESLANLETSELQGV